MQFILTGFTPDTAYRVFGFQGIAADHTRTDFTVRIDLSLVRKYSIRLQELPLLCRGLLERNEPEGHSHALTFTEDDMRLYETTRSADRDAAEKKKSTRRHLPTRTLNTSNLYNGNHDFAARLTPAAVPAETLPSVDEEAEASSFAARHVAAGIGPR